jgi:hypothetical protein
MNYYNNFNIRCYQKKPEINEPDNQLFAYDITCNGAKNFLFGSYKQIYNIIKSEPKPLFYEDNTFTNNIKLFIDYDENITFTNTLEKDKYAEKILEILLLQIANKLYDIYNIKETPIIILMSDTLLKMSLHIIYPDIIFNNIYEMKYFMKDIKSIDQCVYRIGCFRMIYCSKMGKDNKLLYYNSTNYIKPKSDYELFLDACICYTNNKSTLDIIINIDKPLTIIKEKSKNNKTKHIKLTNNEPEKRNYFYKKIDYDIIHKALNKLKSYSTNYNKWLIIGFCLKDLYMCVPLEDQKTIYKLFDDFSKSAKSSNIQDIKNKYIETNNKTIFLNLEPKIDINYLFKMADEPYYILPFYNYQDIIFNPNSHKNIIIKNEKYIDVDKDILLQYKYIFIKSPTGTGKTTFLKEIIDKFKIYNIISITSRKNLAGEHTKQLNLHFYLDLHTRDYEYCDKLVIQLESLKKCNYKLFKDGIIILDEVNSLLSHLRSPTLTNKRKETYLYLIELIKNAKYVISLDADLSDWNIKFLQEIKEDNYIVYYNTNKNKTGTDAILYKCPQIMIDKMAHQIKNKEYFISCFDSLKQMNKIIEYLLKYGNKEDFLIYSSEVNYDLIDTTQWKTKYVFYSPSILYGIDYNYKPVDVYSFVYKNHLNPLQIYQMISRARQQNKVHIYCNERESYIKYNSVEDIKQEIELYEKNFGILLPLYNNYIDIDDKPYRTMYYNYRYMDEILKTNIKEYLIDMLINKGYNIIYDNSESEDKMDNKIIEKTIKEKIVNLLCLDINNLSDLEKNLTSNEKALEKHFNLRILLNNKIDERLKDAIDKNLFIETFKSKYTKIKICMDLMDILKISNLDLLNKSITSNFNIIIDNKWLKDNIDMIKKTFDIRTDKYDDFNYYNIYLLLITILKQLFDADLFIRKITEKKKCKYAYYIIDNKILTEHINIIKQFDKALPFAFDD